MIYDFCVYTYILYVMKPIHTSSKKACWRSTTPAKPARLRHKYPTTKALGIWISLGLGVQSGVNSCQFMSNQWILLYQYRRVLWRIDHLQSPCLVRLVVLVVASNMAICRKDSTAEEAISSQTSHSICGRSPFLSLRKQTATSWWHILKHVCACVGLTCWYRALYSEIVFFYIIESGWHVASRTFWAEGCK